MKVTTLEFADKFIARQQAKGNDCWWDGWTMKFFRAAPSAFYRGGIKRNGKWGYVISVTVSDKGHWNVPPRVVV